MKRVDQKFVEMMPDGIRVPCEHTDAVIDIALVFEDGRVQAPGLDELKGALAVGSADLVRRYCELWTRYLSLATSGAREPS